MEWGVEQQHGAVGVFQVQFQHGAVVTPEFAHRENLAAGALSHGMQPFMEEIEANMLDSVQAEAVDTSLGQEPEAPAFQFLDHRPLGEVQIGEHQVVVVASLAADHAFPVRIRLAELEDGAFTAPLVPVDTIEVLLVPGKAGIFSAPGREVEARPGLDLGFVAKFDASVVWVDAVDAHRLGGIGAGLMVEHDIGVDLDATAVAGLDQAQVVVLAAVLGGDTAFLVELAQVVQVVGAVTDIVNPGGALGGWRQP